MDAFELMTKLTSLSGLISNTNCVRQDQVHNIGGFDQTDVTYVRFINIGDTPINNVKGSLYDPSGNVVGETNPILIDELPAKAHVWRNRNQLSLKEFNLTESHGLKFNTFLQNHSLFQKASSQGYNIDLNCQNGIISNPNNATHSYEASILTDFLRTELIQAGQKITFETVMSHSSKIETLRKLRN